MASRTVFLILKYLREREFKETLHRLEQESGLFFDMSYFEEQVEKGGKWDELERYLSGFTTLEESVEIFFEIRKQKYLAALERQDRAKASDILVNDLKVFKPTHEKVFKEMEELLALDNIREHGDTRKVAFLGLKQLIETSPVFQEKLTFPTLIPGESLNLETLINYSLNPSLTPTKLCKCPALIALPAATTRPLRPPAQVVEVQCSITRLPDPTSSLAGKISSVIFSSSGTFLLALASDATHRLWQCGKASARIQPALVQRSVTMTNDTVAGEAVHCCALSNNERYVFSSSGGKVSIFATNTFKVQKTFKSSPPAATFLALNPQDNNVVAIGMEDSNIEIYNALSGEARKLEGHDKKITGLAFSDAVAVLVSSGADNQLCAWDTNDWRKLRSKKINVPGGKQGDTRVQFHKDRIHFLVVHETLLAIYKAFRLDCIRQWTAKGAGVTSATYSCDCTLVYATFLDGAVGVFDADSLLPRVLFRITLGVYMSDPGAVSCTYPTVVAAHTSQRNLLAIGMSNGVVVFLEPPVSEADLSAVQVVAASPQHKALFLNFGQDPVPPAPALPALPTPPTATTSPGSTTRPPRPPADQQLQVKQTVAPPAPPASAATSTSSTGTKRTRTRPPDQQVQKAARCTIAIKDVPTAKRSQVVELTHGQCQLLKLPDPTSSSAGKISSLVFSNMGTFLLALASDGTHRLWKWAGKASASSQPALVQRNITMTNDSAAGEAVHCCALSNNDSYVLSSSGGKVSIFAVNTFKVHETIKSPPSAATSLAFNPRDNNILAIGMEDSNIEIYNALSKEARKLEGHEKKITGLAFSNVLNVLVSSGSDNQLCVWNTEDWTKLRSKTIEAPGGKQGDTRVQFHMDLTHFLVVHETLLAVYEASNLDLVCQWSAEAAGVTSATYTRDSMLVYATFLDGAIRVFHAKSLLPLFRIHPAIYMPPGAAQSGVCPLVVAAHPSQRNLLAIGLSNGTVLVLESSVSEADWSAVLPDK